MKEIKKTDEQIERELMGLASGVFDQMLDDMFDASIKTLRDDEAGKRLVKIAESVEGEVIDHEE